MVGWLVSVVRAKTSKTTAVANCSAGATARHSATVSTSRRPLFVARSAEAPRRDQSSIHTHTHTHTYTHTHSHGEGRPRKRPFRCYHDEGIRSTAAAAAAAAAGLFPRSDTHTHTHTHKKPAKPVTSKTEARQVKVETVETASSALPTFFQFKLRPFTSRLRLFSWLLFVVSTLPAVASESSFFFIGLVGSFKKNVSLNTRAFHQNSTQKHPCSSGVIS